MYVERGIDRVFKGTYQTTSEEASDINEQTRYDERGNIYQSRPEGGGGVINHLSRII